MGRERSRQCGAAPPGVRRSPSADGSLCPLPVGFFARSAERVAADLLGCRVLSLVDGVRTVGEIVETEAYVGPHDEASHAHERIGRTSRNAAMFGPPGIAYVYRIYGLHWCLNVVTDAVEHPAAVLIRALRPLDGLEAARARRPGRPDAELMRGPGNLAAALGVTGALDAHDLGRPPLWLERGDPVPAAEIARGARVGVTRAADLPLRFWVRGSPCVSRSR